MFRSATDALSRTTFGIRPVLRVFALWHRRQRTRHQLLTIEEWQLRDVGITPRQARNEARRWS